MSEQWNSQHDKELTQETHSSSREEKSEYAVLLEELGQLQEELKKDERDPSLADFLKIAFEKFAVQKTLWVEYLQHEIGAELQSLSMDIINRVTSTLDTKNTQDESDAARLEQSLTPQLAGLLMDVRERAFIYLASKEKDREEASVITLIWSRQNEFAGQKGIFPALFRRAWRIFSEKIS